MTGYFETAFLKDTADFLQRLTPLLARFETGAAAGKDIDEAFRLVHSIKSEAAHLGRREIADFAHRAESALQELRENPADTVHLNQVYNSTARIESLLNQEQPVDAPADGTDVPFSESVAKKVETDTRGPLFNDFERILLAESKDRGEHLYRMVCDFDDETEMKYLKAVLILNNLEQLVNVIRSVPDLSVTRSEQFNSVEYYFTSDKAESELFEAVHIDQVRRVFLSRLAWAQHLPEPGDTEEYTGRSDRSDQVVVPFEQLSRLWFGLLMGRTALPSAELEKNFGLKQAFDDMASALDSTRFLSFGSAFSDLSAVVEQAAREQAKEARCEIQGRDMPIERWLVWQLRDSIIQLLRNAVSHGIEDRTTRLKEEKSPRGEIRVIYERNEDEVRVVISDDGRGIDESAVRRKAMELGFEATEPLLRILTSPGFSTSEAASLHSGRGVGLDIVAEGIMRLRGAQLHLETGENAGTRFIISVPLTAVGRHLLLARHKNRILAIDSTDIKGREEPLQDRFARDSEGRIEYNGLPVYTCDGYLFWIEGFPEQEHLLKIEKAGKAFYLLVDEILFEATFPQDYIREQDIELSPLAKIFIGSLQTEVFHLRTDKLLSYYDNSAITNK